MLAEIKGNCLGFDKNKSKEGDLVYIDNVRLSLLNEDEVRALITVMSGTFDGITIPEAGGLDVGHLFQSFIKSGTSFKLIGRIGDGKSNGIILKIPIDGADLFESGYSIDDLSHRQSRNHRNLQGKSLSIEPSQLVRILSNKRQDG